MKIHNVGNEHVNIYLIDSGTHRLLIDTGFPDQFNDLGKAMRSTGFGIKDINYVMVTHFHIDHAGILQPLKNEGAKVVVFTVQQDHIKPMEKMFSGKKWDYKYLSLNDNHVIKTEESRNFLKQLGIMGQVIPTPGHSADSVSLVLDSGETFIGDLLPEKLIMNDNSVEKKTWAELRKRGARFVYPGHGNMFYV